MTDNRSAIFHVTRTAEQIHAEAAQQLPATKALLEHLLRVGDELTQSLQDLIDGCPEVHGEAYRAKMSEYQAVEAEYRRAKYGKSGASE